MINPNRHLRIFIIAGEASGDILGASFIKALKNIHPNAEFYGVGGEQMQKEGFQSIFPMEELSVMGLAEVLPKLFSILKRIKQTVNEIIIRKPDVVLTIDSPDFCFRVVKKLKAQNKKIPCVHYVAPSVWAWRPGRAKKVSEFLDHILTLLPFEPPYFEEHGLKATFIGHPIVEKISSRGDGERFRQKYNIASNDPILSILPGSRVSEISRLLTVFAKTSDKILQKKPNTVIVIPTLPHLKKYIEDFFRGKGINPIITTDIADKFDCFAASSVAIAASGTVSLELALTDTPHIIAYKVSPISAFFAKFFIKTKYFNLVNILLNKLAIPELLQERCDPNIIYQEVLKLLEEKQARTNQLVDFREALIKIGLSDTETPSDKAANTVLEIIDQSGAPLL